MDYFSEIVFLLLGAFIGFIPQFYLKDKLETRSKRTKLSKAILANLKSHQKIINETKIPYFDQQFFEILMQTGEITLFNDEVVTMIMQYNQVLTKGNRTWKTRQTPQGERVNDVNIEIMETATGLRSLVLSCHLYKKNYYFFGPKEPFRKKYYLFGSKIKQG